MSLLLAVETSGDRHAVALGRSPADVFDSTRAFPSDTTRDLRLQVSRVLSARQEAPSDVKGVVVNIGPGALSSIRSGVAFANAFAFSLSIPIYPLTHFEVLHAQARVVTTLPVLCAIPAPRNTAYVALLFDGSVERMQFGTFEPTVANAVDGLSEIAVVGHMRARLIALLTSARAHDTGIDRPDVKVVFDLGWDAYKRGQLGIAQTSPLTEQSEVFR